MKRLALSSLIIFISGISLVNFSVAAPFQLFRGSEAPGVLAHKRLIAEPGIANYDQPVQIIVPDGGFISRREQGFYSQPTASRSLLGMRVGPVYGLRVSALLRGREQTVYPTVEMLDRLYPPEGLALRHPVKLVITPDDIEDAVAGRMVTKVIYLEYPDTALPYRQRYNEQAVIDVGPGQDPYRLADRLGRPMILVRIGSRQPLDQVSNPVLDHQPAPLPLIEYAAVNENFSSKIVNSNFSDVGQPGSQSAVHNCECPESVDTLSDGCMSCDTGWETIDNSNCTSIGDGCGVSSGGNCGDGFRCTPEEVARLPQARRDEFVCDGNDRNFPVVVDADWKLRGLDSEDTIAHFDTLAGRVQVVPSNRVCIYAPRFAAVRRTQQSRLETITQKLNVVNKNVPLLSSQAAEFSTTTLQNVQLQANRKTEKPAAFRDRTRGVVTDNTVRLSGTRNQFKPFEDLQLVRFGDYSASESARLELAIQSARAWESDLRAQLTFSRSQGVIVNDVQMAQEIVAVESETSPNLRLCKLASKISAQPDDPVDFTIRFDNIGREKIGNVTIIDELSPRLEYIEGTAECSIEADFTARPNAGGSSTLRWEIVDPLDLREGGIIRFQCRVR